MTTLQFRFKDNVLYIFSDFDSIYGPDMLSFGNDYLMAECLIYRILMYNFLKLDVLNDC